VGENSKENDLVVNAAKGKQLNNIRAAGKDESIILTTPRTFTLENAISYIEDDELIEITPDNIRIRCRELDPNQRKK